MEKRALGRTGMNIGPVVFGGIINMKETQKDADAFVSGAVASGVNYFDVAPSYGDAEDRLGPALSRYRAEVFLACKTGKRRAMGAKAELLSSLRKLHTDHFDVYQLHGLTTTEDVATVFGPGGAMETFVWAKREGLIRNIGFSTHSENAALEALKLYDFDTVLFPMNWALGINAGWGDRISKLAAERGFGLLAMKTLIHRKWRDGEARPYPKSWCKPIYGDEALAVAAMKYGFSKGAAALVPPGNHEHFAFMLEHVARALSAPLTEAEWALLRAEAESVKGEMIFDPFAK